MQIDVTALQDGELLQAIAQRRDEQAFAVLYQRHQRAAYGLALYLVRDRHLAEEALQEAMLSVWSAAGTCRCEDARGWILKIIARKAFVISSKRRVPTTDSPEDLPGQRPWAPSPPGHSQPETQELVQGLREALSRLPRLDQQLLALHFGASLSHAEISGLLKLPRRTVSFRVRNLLEELGSQLRKAGFKEGHPALASPGLEALLTQTLAQALQADSERPPPPPPNWALRSNPIVQAAPRSKTSATLVLSMGCGLVLALGVWGLQLRQDPKPRPAGPTAARLPPTPASGPQVASGWTWSADQDPRGLLKPLLGEWLWVPPSPGGPGRLVAPKSMATTLLELPFRAPKRPFLVEFSCQVEDNSHGDFFVGYRKDRTVLGFQGRHRQGQLPIGQRVGIRCCFVGKTSVCMVQGKVLGTAEYETEYPSPNLLLAMSNRHLLSLTAREMTEEETVQAQEQAASLAEAPSATALKQGLSYLDRAEAVDPGILPVDPLQFRKGLVRFLEPPRQEQTLAAAHLKWVEVNWDLDIRDLDRLDLRVAKLEVKYTGREQGQAFTVPPGARRMQIEVDLRSGPILIGCEGSPSPQNNSSWGSRWIRQGQGVPVLSWVLPLSGPLAWCKSTIQPRYLLSVILWGEYSIYVSKQADYATVTRCRSPYPSDTVRLQLDNFALRTLELSALKDPEKSLPPLHELHQFSLERGLDPQALRSAAAQVAR